MDNEKPELWGLGKYTPGGSEWEAHNGMQVGDTWVPANKMNQDVRDAYRGLDVKLYPTADGNYTKSFWKSDVSVVLDKKTGNITVNAPKEIMDEDWFKQAYSENESLKKLSQAYKLNPDYAYETTDENGKTVYKKAEELVNEYDAGLKKAISDLNTLYTERDRVLRPVYGSKVDNMSTEDIRTALTPTYNVGDIKVTDSTVISLPDFLLNHSIFGNQIKALSSYNAENGTVTRGDFMENFWNRNKNPELTAERIQELYQNLGTTLKYSNWEDVVEDDYERHGANQAAREIAFRNFIQGQDPEADFWLQAGDTVTGIIGGVGIGLADWSIGLASAFEWMGNNLTFWDGRDEHGVQQMAQGWDDWKDYNNEQLQLISDTSAAWTNIAEMVTELVANIKTGNFVGEIVAAGVGVPIVATMQKLNINQMSGLGKTLAAFTVALESTPEAGKIIKSAVGAQKVFTAGGALAGSIVNITTQAIVDAALTDPVLFRRAIEGEGGEEAYNYLNEQFAWNVGGFAVGIGLGKLAMGAANTKVGRAINAKWAKGNAKLKTIGYNISDGLKAKIAHRSLEDVIAQQDEVAKTAKKSAKGMYDVQSMRTAEQLDTLKAETRAFAKADIDVFEGLKISDEGLAEAEKYLTNIKALQNAIDMENRSLRLIVEGYDDIKINPEMAGLNKKMYDDVMEVNKRQSEMINSTGKTFTRMEGSVFSQEAANYIGASIEVKYMEAVLGNPNEFAKGTVESAAKHIDSYREAIAAYTKEFSPELKTALDTYIADGKQWYASMNKYRASKGLTNAQDLEDLLKNPMFDEGDYMRVQRKIDKRYKTVTLEDGTRHTNINIEFQHLEFADMSDFMAPDTVQSLYKINTANAERNLSVLKTRLSVSSAVKTTLVSGEETQMVKTIKANKPGWNEAAKEQISKITKDNATFDAREIVENYRKTVELGRKESSLVSDISKTEKGIEKTTEKTYRINDTDRVIAAQTLAPTDVRSILTDAGKSKTGSVLQDGIDEFGDDAVAFNKWYQALPDESKNTINRIRRDYNEYIGGMPNDARPMSFQEWFGGETGEASLEGLARSQSTDEFFAMFSEEDAAKLKKEIGKLVDPKLEAVGAASKNQLPKLNRQQYYEDTIGRLKKGGGTMSYQDIPKEMRSHLKTAGRGAEAGAINNDEVLRELFNDNSSYITELYEKYENLVYGPAKGEFTEEKFVDWVTNLSNEEAARYEAQIANKLNLEAGLTGAEDGARLSRVTRDNLKTLIGVDPNLEDTINLQVLKNDKTLLKTDRISQMAEESKRADDYFIRNNVLETQKKELVNVIGERATDEFMDRIVEFSDKTIDNFITQMKNDPKASKYARAIADATGDSEDDVVRYLALTALEKNQAEINKQIRSAFGTGNSEMTHIGTQVENAFDSLLENYVDSMMMAMSDSELVSGELWDRVSDLAKKIEDVSSEAADDFSNVIMTTDTQGRKMFMQVDPVVAKLFKTNIGHLQKPTSRWDDFNKLLSKTFRLGTTGLNLSSTLRQWFRDSGNAFSMGGAFRKIQSCADELVDDWGERIVQQLSDYDLGQLTKRAEETGIDIKKLAVDRELRMGALAAGQTTEVTLYRESLTKAQKLQENVKNVRQRVDDLMNGMRENYLRNRVYANNLLQAMNNGKTLEEARVLAEFAMNNATTNFSRKLVHLQRMADSAPYLSAAINGTKSFWRIATLDPVGVTTRIMAGFVIPQMYLTASSLTDENDRRVYENLPEYTKSDNLVFVQNGVPITIPIPQELSVVVDPFRQFTEYLHGANKNNFLELAANDILGSMPLDLSGFTAVDMDNLVSDPTIFDRIGRGSARVFSQVAPIPVKSAYMLATGIDPYSGKKLTDKSWVVWNDDIGDYETMDYNQGEFTKLVASWCGENANATVIGKVLSGVFGNTGMDVADTIVATFQRVSGDESADPLTGLKSQISNIGESMTGEDYSLLNSEWRRTITQLEEERDAIMASKAMQDIQTKLSQDIDDDTRAKLIAKRKDLLSDWQKKVASSTQRLVEQGGTLDRYKFGAVVQLLNMNSVNGWLPENKYLQNLASQNYYAGRNEAYRTLKAIGIEGASDYSIFGYIKYKDGEPTVVYNTPTSIITAQNLLLSAKDVDKANIDAIIKKADLYTQREAMYNQTDAIYNKGKLTNADYNAIDAIKMAYNNKVIATLTPYLEKVSPEAITNNEQVMDVLENLIQVPSAYEKVNNRFVSSGGGKLNKQQGFVRSYIKAILNKDNI